MFVRALEVTESGARGWTDAQILAAIREWHLVHGEVPSQADWDPYRARSLGQEWRIRRYQAGDWPSLKTVINRFGRLSTAVAEAGLAPREVWSGRTNRSGARRHAFSEPLDGSNGEGHRRDRLVRSVKAVAAAERTSPGALHAALVALAQESLAWADAVHHDSGSHMTVSTAASRHHSSHLRAVR